MSRSIAAALSLDFELDDDGDCHVLSPEAAMVRGRDGVLRAVDIARLAWPDETATAGVDYMADLYRSGPLNRC